MSLPRPDDDGRHHVPDGYVWESKSGNGWCAWRHGAGTLWDGELPKYFASGEEAAGALQQPRESITSGDES